MSAQKRGIRQIEGTRKNELISNYNFFNHDWIAPNKLHMAFQIYNREIKKIFDQLQKNYIKENELQQKICVMSQEDTFNHDSIEDLMKSIINEENKISGQNSLWKREAQIKSNKLMVQLHSLDLESIQNEINRLNELIKTQRIKLSENERLISEKYISNIYDLLANDFDQNIVRPTELMIGLLRGDINMSPQIVEIYLKSYNQLSYELSTYNGEKMKLSVADEINKEVKEISAKIDPSINQDMKFTEKYKFLSSICFWSILASEMAINFSTLRMYMDRFNELMELKKKYSAKLDQLKITFPDADNPMNSISEQYIHQNILGQFNEIFKSKMDRIKYIKENLSDQRYFAKLESELNSFDYLIQNLYLPFSEESAKRHATVNIEIKNPTIKARSVTCSLFKCIF